MPGDCAPNKWRHAESAQILNVKNPHPLPFGQHDAPEMEGPPNEDTMSPRPSLSSKSHKTVGVAIARPVSSSTPLAWLQLPHFAQFNRSAESSPAAGMKNPWFIIAVVEQAPAIKRDQYDQLADL